MADHRRERSRSDSRDRSHRHRARGEDYRSSRRRDDHRDSSYKDSRRREYESPREHRDYRDDSDGDRRRRHRHADDRRRRRDRDRDTYDERDRPSRRRRSRSDPRSRSPPRRHSRSPSSSHTVQRSKRPLPSQKDAYTSSDVAKKDSSAPPAEREKPNFGTTGRLAAESNTVNVGGDSVVLKYHEPPEARKPPAKEPWRLYVFKGEDMLEVVELGERSCWLIGREHLVVDFPLEHPSCSKQHAALQFRFVEKRNEFGDRIGKVKPYIIDLESANGTSVNAEPVPAGRFIEIMDKDIIRFGLSSREYVLMLPPPS